VKTIKLDYKSDEQRRIVAYLDSIQARLVSLPLAAKRLEDFVRELQSQTQEELDALLPSHRDASQSVLDRAFKGEL
jgi:hypothetical protein